MSGAYNNPYQSRSLSATNSSTSNNSGHGNGNGGGSNRFVYTQMSNPYSSTPPSFESMLTNLARTGNIPSISVVQSLQGYISTSSSSSSTPRSSSLNASSTTPENNSNSSIEWTVDLAQTLTNYTNELLTTHSQRAPHTTAPSNAGIPPSISAMLLLLVSAMEQWEDRLVYATIVQNERTASTKKNSSKSLLELLYQLAENMGHPIHSTAILGISVVWDVLDRIQQQTTSLVDGSSSMTTLSTVQRFDTPWWIPTTVNFDQLTSVLMIHLCNARYAPSPNCRPCCQRGCLLEFSPFAVCSFSLIQYSVAPIILRRE